MGILKRIIGFSLLWPWSKYRFASKEMTPRFDANGDIYMLLCVEQEVTKRGTNPSSS
jgi:hypothetical protein